MSCGLHRRRGGAGDRIRLGVPELATRSVRALAASREHVARNQAICSVAVTPDGRELCRDPGDKTLKVWDLGTGQAVATLQGHSEPVTAVAVTLDGRDRFGTQLRYPNKDRGSARDRPSAQGHVPAMVSGFQFPLRHHPSVTSSRL